MKKNIFFMMLFCLALAFTLSNSVTSKAQAPDPTATPAWVKPTSSGDELPPFLNPPPGAGAVVQAPQVEPASPDWALDWNRMVFQSYRDGNWEIYSSYGNGVNQNNLTNRSYCSDARPKVNHDLTRIVFNSDPNGSADIYVMNYDGSGLTNLTDNSNRLDYAGAWSPDSSRIVYVSNSYGAHRGDPVEVYVMNADGSAKTRLTYSGLANDGPNWSPDGSLIAWIQYPAAGPVLMVMNADSSNQHAIIGPLNYMWHFAWSPDGSMLAIDYDADGDTWNELAVMNADGTGLHTIYDPGCTLCDAWIGDWSANGQWLLFSGINYIVVHGQLYLSSAYVEAWHLVDGNRATLTSSGYDMNPSWQSTDLLPPVSQVDTLPEYSLASGFEITWTARDEGPSGLANYRFQYRLGPSGVWEDLTGYIYGMTSLPFSSETYDTVYFRSQVEDNAENWEPWPAGDGDTWTNLYSWLFDGKVADNRGVLLANAAVSISPAPWETDTTTDRTGEFQVHIKDEGNHTLNASLAGYGTTEPASVYIKGQKSLDRYLPPTENLLVNGNFEASSSQLTGWTASDTLTPTIVTGFSGQNAAGLGYDCGIPCLTAPEAISPTAGLYSYPKMAIDKDGNVHMIYVDPRIFYFTRPPGGTWSEPFEVGVMYSGNEPERTYNDMAVDSEGGVHIVWSGANGVEYRQRHPNGTWDPATVATQYGFNPAIGVDDVGGVHVIYYCPTQFCPGMTDGWYYINRSPSGTWSSPILLVEVDHRGPVDIVVGPDRTVHFLFNGVYMTRKPDGTLTRPEGVLGLPDYGQNTNQLRLDGDGVLHAFAAIGGETAYAYKLPGGSWTTPEVWNDNIFFADMDIDQQGRLHVYGITGDYHGRYILIDRHEPRVIVNIDTDSGNGGAIGVDPENNLHLIWISFEHLNYQTSPHALTEAVSAISQAVSIPQDLNQPTLSYMYKLWGEADCHNSEFQVSVSDGLTTTQVYADQDCNGWSHGWIDMSPWVSQTVTVTLALHQAAGDPFVHLYLDETSLGAWLTPVVNAVTPDGILAWISSTITITGENFIATPAVQLNDIIVTDVEWVDGHTLHLHLPAGLPPGIYTIRVTNPGGQEGICPSVLKVGNLTYMPLAIRPAAP